MPAALEPSTVAARATTGDRPLSRARATASLAASSPHAALGTGAVAVLALEAFRGSATLDTSAVWPLAQAFVSAVTLAVAWLRRDGLRLVPLLGLGLGFHLAWIALHLARGVAGDHDPVNVYPLQGNTLLHGEYPESEYPPGAVALFTVETWLGDGAARTANAFLMVPFQLLCISAVWAFRMRWTPWLAAVVALWPLNAFYWEFRFDLVPTAALVVGLLFAWRAHWYEAGFVLGLGAIVKWTPALAVIPLVLWLLRSGRFRSAGIHVVGFAIPLLLVHVPLLLWRPHEVLHAYTMQNERTVTAESFVFLPLQLFRDAEPGYWYFGTADVDANANRDAIVFQLVAVACVTLVAVLSRTRSAAVAVAGLTPAVFLLTNRIFSPQFYVLVLAAIVVAAALVVRRRAELLAVIGACAVATTANTILFQSLLGAQPVETVPNWQVVSSLAYVPTIVAALWLCARAVLQSAEPAYGTALTSGGTSGNRVPGA
jgi:uncharacterized membrane protein